MARLLATVVRLCPAGILLILLLSMRQSPLRIAPDCALYIQTGQLLLQGKLPYTDFVDLNPPLIMYMNTLPVLAGRVLGIHPIVAFNLLLVALIAWSTLAVRRELAAMRTSPWSASADVVAAAWAGLSLVLWLANPWDINDFGQREHLFVLLWFPYVLLRCRRFSDTQTSAVRAIFLGAMGALGSCVKPYFLVVALAVEAVLFLRHRSLRRMAQPEVVAFATVGAAYAAHFLLLPADVREALFGRWMPFLVRHYSVYTTKSASEIKPVLVVALAAGVVSVALAHRRRARTSPVSPVFAALGVFNVGAVAIYYWQFKGFFYQLIPALAGATVLLALALAEALRLVAERIGSGSGRALVVSSPVLLGWLLLAQVTMTQPSLLGGRNEGNPFLDPFRSLFETYAQPGEPIMILNSSVWPAYPTLVQLGRLQASRFLVLFPFPLLQHARKVGDFAYTEEQFFSELAADIDTYRPPLVIFWGGPRRKGPARAKVGGLFGYMNGKPAPHAALAQYQLTRHPGLPPQCVILVRSDRVRNSRHAVGRAPARSGLGRSGPIDERVFSG